MIPKILICGFIYSPSDNTVLTNMLIYIDKDGFIENICPNIGEINTSYEVVDLSNLFVMPGLIDAHCHPFIYDLNDYQLSHIKENSSYKTLRALKRVQHMLKYGWTTIRICGDADVEYGVISLKRAIKEKIFVGPRIFGAAHYISSTGGGGDFLLSNENNCIHPDGKIVNGVEEMRKVVREEIKYGSDWIKILCSGAFMTSHDNPRDCHFSDEEIKMAVSESNRRQVPVCAHAHSINSIKSSVLAGVKSIEHGTFIDEDHDIISIMKENNVYLVPTLYIKDYFSKDDLCNKYKQIHYQGVNNAYNKGVKIVCGTDNVGWCPSLNVNELLCLSKAGLSNNDVLKSATYTAAEMLNIHNSIGDIKIGYKADLIAIDGNPLENINILLNPFKMVMIDGIIV